MLLQFFIQLVTTIFVPTISHNILTCILENKSPVFNTNSLLCQVLRGIVPLGGGFPYQI